MPQLPCPSCRTTLAIPETALGKSVRCPKCTNVFLAEEPIQAVEVIAELPPAPPSVVPLAFPDGPGSNVASISETPLPQFAAPPMPMPPVSEEPPWNQPPNPLQFEDPHAPFIRMTNRARAEGKRAGSWLVMGASLHIFLLVCSAGLSFASGAGHVTPAHLVGQVCGLFLGVGAGVLILIGGTSVANLRNKVLGYMASILGLLFGVLTGLGAFVFCFFSMQLSVMRLHDAGVVILGAMFLMLAGISVCYLVGGVLALLVLASPAAQGEFERHHHYRR